MTIDINTMAELKNCLKENFGLYLHCHDCCGGQSFSFDTKPSAEAMEYIVKFFTDKNLTVTFTPDKCSFVAR